MVDSVLARDPTEEGGGAWDHGTCLSFDGMLDDPSIPDLTLQESVNRFEGLRFWHGPSRSSKVYKAAYFKVQLEDCYSFVDDGMPSALKEELKHISRELLATVHAWTMDFCYILLSVLRDPDRTVDTVKPVMPFMKNFTKALHLLPSRFIKQGDVVRADMGVRSNWSRKMKVGGTLQFFTPSSFTTDVSVLETFFSGTGPRTLTKLVGCIGYDVSELSHYPMESELLLEGVTFAEIIAVEAYTDEHDLVMSKQVASGLHYVVARQIRGMSVMAGSPVRSRELRCIATAGPAEGSLASVHPSRVIKGNGFAESGSHTGSSELRYDKALETVKLPSCMDTWQKSSRCCSSACGDLCGIVIMNLQDSGHCRNVLFERCDRHGGNGHDKLILEYTSHELDYELIYGYSVQGGQIRLNSGTFNGFQMPDVMKRVLPKVFEGTRGGGKIVHSLR